MKRPSAKTGILLACGGGLSLLALLGFASIVLWAPAVFAEESALSDLPADVLKWGFAAAAFATGLSSVAAAYAVAHVGSAGVGAMAEKPDLFGRVLVMVGLAEGIAIYGLIVSILILNRLG